MDDSPTQSDVQSGSSFANAATRGIVGAMLAWHPLESLLLPCIRGCRSVQPFKAIWWRLRGEYSQQTRGTDRELRWFALPHARSKLLAPINSDFGCFFFENDVYEAETTDTIQRLLAPGSVFVDIGANIGYFTIVAADRVGHHGHVYAFEPNPLPHRLLEQSIRRNAFETRIDLLTCALSDVDDQEVEFFVGRDVSSSTISSLNPWEGHLESGALSETQSIKVPSRTFDSIAAELDVKRIDVIKIDVEGAEMLVFNGMRGSLAQYKPRHIICETGLRGGIATFLAEVGYRAEPIQYLNPEAEWGNILFSRE